jgi:hypothetical protein
MYEDFNKKEGLYVESNHNFVASHNIDVLAVDRLYRIRAGFDQHATAHQYPGSDQYPTANQHPGSGRCINLNAICSRGRPAR